MKGASRHSDRPYRPARYYMGNPASSALLKAGCRAAQQVAARAPARAQRRRVEGAHVTHVDEGHAPPRQDWHPRAQQVTGEADRIAEVGVVRPLDNGRVGDHHRAACLPAASAERTASRPRANRRSRAGPAAGTARGQDAKASSAGRCCWQAPGPDLDFVAEREGFEPPGHLHARLLSRQLQSTRLCHRSSRLAAAR